MRRRRYLMGAGAGIGGLLVALQGGSAVTRDGTTGESGPLVEQLSTTPGAGDTVGTDASIEVETVVADPDGLLDRIVWLEGRNHTIIEEVDVSGSRATDSLTFDETPHWIDYGYPTMVTVVTEDGRESDLETVEGPTVRQPLEIDILGTNSPVAAGAPLDVTAAVENVGDMMMVGPDTQEVELVVGGETVDAETVSVGWSETETITLGYDTYPVQQDVEFPVRVEGADDADERTVEVLADGSAELTVTITGTNDPVAAGDPLDVTAEIRNDGSVATTEDVTLDVGGEVVDSQSVTVPAGTAEAITLGYDTYPVQQDVEFPVVVEAGDATDQQSVEVFAEGESTLTVAGVDANDPVSGGEFLEVTATVENAGPAEVSQSVALVVAGDTVDTETVAVPAGESRSVSLGYETYPVRQDVTFSVTVQTEDDSASNTVEVYGVD